MIQTTQRILLFLILFFSISQLGKHFWLNFSYVSGIRVDYLSPTLYFSDLLIFLLFLITLPTAIRSISSAKKENLKWLVLGLLLITLSVAVSPQSQPAFYGVIKLAEMVFLGWVISRLFKAQDFSKIAFVLSFAVLLESVLVVWQFINQSSVGGLFYLIGERSFSIGTVGISTVSIFGKEYLRAYGSFPHPNVLAFFMLSAVLILVVYMFNLSWGLKKIWFGAASSLAFICLFLTFSRLTIVVFVLSLLWLGYKKLIPARFVLFVVASSVVVIGALFQRFSLTSLSTDFFARIELASIAISIITQSPVFGVGILNYFSFQLPHQTKITPLLLQPVHNIYLLVLLQVGMVGFLLFLRFIIASIRRMKSVLATDHRMGLVVVILSVNILIIGMADHFFITLQQGIVLVAFIFGLLWVKYRVKTTL